MRLLCCFDVPQIASSLLPSADTAHSTACETARPHAKMESHVYNRALHRILAQEQKAAEKEQKEAQKKGFDKGSLQKTRNLMMVRGAARFTVLDVLLGRL